MKTLRTATLKFLKVEIDVGVAAAITKTNAISFRNLHNCGAPVESKKKKLDKPEKLAAVKEHLFCSACGVEVTDVIKGWEYAPGKFIPLTDDEIASTKAPSTTAIRINKFVPRNQVTATMVANSHFLTPNPNVPTNYGVLFQTLAELKVAGVGTHALFLGKEHPCAIYADQSYEGHGVLIMETLHVHEDLVRPDFSAPIPPRAEKRLMKEVISNEVVDLIPTDDLISLERSRMKGLIEAKLSGAEIETTITTEDDVATIDLMEALRESIALQGAKKPRAKAGRTKT